MFASQGELSLPRLRIYVSRTWHSLAQQGLQLVKDKPILAPLLPFSQYAKATRDGCESRQTATPQELMARLSQHVKHPQTILAACTMMARTLQQSLGSHNR